MVRGFAPGGLDGLGGVLILVSWFYGTLVLSERRSGLIMMLLGSMGGLGVLVLHMTGAGLVGGRIALRTGPGSAIRGCHASTIRTKSDTIVDSGK